MMISPENFCRDGFWDALAKETKAALQHLENLKFLQFLQKNEIMTCVFQKQSVENKVKI